MKTEATPSFKKTLRFTDLLLFNIVAIVSIRWLSVAAAAGSESLGLWILAMISFFIPQALAVAHFSRTQPEESLYGWTKKAFGNFHGFFCGWCYWINNVFYFPGLLLFVSANFAIALWGVNRGQELQESKYFVTGMAIGILALIAVLNIVGLRIGKWLNNLGAFATWVPTVILIGLASWSFYSFGSANEISWSNIFPHIQNREQTSFFAELCFGFAGFELVSFLSRESKDPSRTLPLSIGISGVIIAGIYIIGTLAILVSLPSEKISTVNGIVLTIQTIEDKIGIVGIALISAGLIGFGMMGQTMAWFAGASRVPYLVGVDRYLPKAFSKLHPRFQTPHIAILVQFAVASIFALVATAGQGTQIDTAYRILVDMCLILYFIPYLYLFLALFREKQSVGFLKTSISRWIVLLLGFTSTALAMIMAVLPKTSTEGWGPTFKILGGSLIMFGIGFYLYLAGRKKLEKAAL